VDRDRSTVDLSGKVLASTPSKRADMKKLLGLILLGSLAACGNNAGEKPADNSTTNDTTANSRLTNDSISIPHERDRTVDDTAQNSNVTRSSDSTAP
jgi:hypothetical protein